jgi:hypothetical protein
LPQQFNHAVKYSIAALGELLMHTVNTAFQVLGLKERLGRYWGVGFLDEEAKNSMKSHGWCASDIARVESKYKSTQGLYVARMMDKSLPIRNHENCTDSLCKFFQIDMGGFKLQHQQDDCTCGPLPLEVDSERLEDILREDGIFPVLRFTGDLHDLKAEVVESELDIPYVAISHVWADGLGNPNSNALHRCKLHHLRKLVASIDSQDLADAPLIWLDTLCCPSQDGDGKQLAIEKIRLVYQKAKHVLVLDAGLMAYSASDQDEFEQLTRIFTSGWMRRLWTLQEGALAESLYFRFADKPVSLMELINGFVKKCNHMKYKALFMDLWNEFQGLRTFFHPTPDMVSKNELSILDQSLDFRSVSVLTDEPLCIGTLMSLNLREILNVEDKNDRMKKAWELIAAKKGGIPTQVIFFPEARIDADGWRWAPKSLLQWARGSHEEEDNRYLKWHDSRLGKITDQGLRVQCGGYRVTIAKGDGGEKPPLWPGFSRCPENTMLFRDKDTGVGYHVYDREHALRNLTRTDEQKEAHRSLGLFPLHDIAETGDAVLLINSSMVPVQEINEGLFGTLTNEPSKSHAEGVAVTTGRIVLAAPARSQSAYMYDNIRRLALHIRTDELVEKHKEIYNRLAQECQDSPDLLETAMENSEAFKNSVKEIREKMKRMVEELAAEDEKFAEAVQSSGEVNIDSVWVWIYDFVVDDYVGEKIGEEQVWFVD